MEGGGAAVNFGVEGEVDERYGGVSTGGGHETSEKAGVCLHARGGTPKGAP